MQGFVHQDGNGGAIADEADAGKIAGGDRLLDELDVEPSELLDGRDGFYLGVPHLVGVSRITAFDTERMASRFSTSRGVPTLTLRIL